MRALGQQKKKGPSAGGEDGPGGETAFLLGVLDDLAACAEEQLCRIEKAGGRE